MSTAWTKGDRKARRQLEKTLKSDETDNVARFALVRLLATKADPVAAEELLRGPGTEEKMLADPTTRVAVLSSLGGAYLMLWRARGETTSGNYSSSGKNDQGNDATRGLAEIRLDVSSDRMDLLHRAQHFLQEALLAPENLNDPALRGQIAFCKEARGDCKEALALYAKIISDSALSPGASSVIFRTSVLLAYVGRFDERALALCERAYAADPLHAGAKRRLSGWAPDKWKEIIAKEEERREAIAEMRRLADLSGRKADAMLARRRRREKTRLFRAWRCLHDKRKDRRRRRAEGGEQEEEEAARNRGGGVRRIISRKDDGSSSSSSGGSGGSGSSSDSGTLSSSGYTGSSRPSAAGGSSNTERSSSFASSLSTKEQPANSADETSSLSSSASPPPSFPVPSAADAAEAGRANFATCFQAEAKRAGGAAIGGREAKQTMASVEIAAGAVHEAMFGGGRRGAHGFVTPAMRALARFKWHRKTHEAEITRVVYGL
eukprot:g8959.t1